MLGSVYRSWLVALAFGLVPLIAPARAEELRVWSEPLEGVFTLSYPSAWAVQQSRFDDVLLTVTAPPPQQAGCEVNRVNYSYRVAHLDQDSVNGIVAGWSQSYAVELSAALPSLSPQVLEYRTEPVGPGRVASLRLSYSNGGRSFSRQFLLARHPLLLYSIRCVLLDQQADPQPINDIIGSLTFVLDRSQ